MKANIAIIIKTAPKRKSLLWLINSAEIALKNHYYRFYIADEQVLDDWKIYLYKKLINQGHYIKVWDEPVAVTVARNHLIENLEEEDYVLRVDDDFELGGEFNIDKLLQLLESNDQIDFCSDVERQIGDGKTKSGCIRIESGFIKFCDKSLPIIYLKRDNNWHYREHNGVRFVYADYLRNLILIKRGCFTTVKWENELYFSGEHLDFYLELKKNGFQGAFTPDSIHLHRDDIKQTTVDIEKEQTWRKSNVVRDNKKELFKIKWGGIPKKKYRLTDRILKKVNNILFEYK